MPVFNASKYLEESIQSILQQTYSNLELVLVDDGSTDDSFKIANNFQNEKVKLFHNPGKGACAARNFAFENSSGDFIQYLDSDDLISTDKIQKQIERLSEFDFAEDILSFSSFRNLRNNIIEINKVRVIDKDYHNPKELLVDLIDTTFNLPHCYLTPRSLILRSGGWDEKVIKNQDGEFFSRILFLARKAVFVPNVYAIWRHTGTGISSSESIRTLESQLYVCNNIADLILSYSISDRTRHIVSSQYGWIAYLNYPDNIPLLPKIKEDLKKRNLSLNIPYRGRLFSFFRLFLGWKLAARIVKNKNVIKFCAWITELTSKIN